MNIRWARQRHIVLQVETVLEQTFPVSVGDTYDSVDAGRFPTAILLTDLADRQEFRGPRGSQQTLQGFHPLDVAFDLGHENSMLQAQNGLLDLSPINLAPGEGGTEFDLRQWVSPSSTRLSLVTAVQHFTFTSSARGILLHPKGWPGTTPVSQALPWALAWSTILCCPPHTSCPSVYRRGGRHLRHGGPWRSDGQHVPVPMAPHAAKTDPASKTGGPVVHRGRPYEKVPPPAGLRPLVSTVLRGYM